jgi:hypothetical protein
MKKKPSPKKLSKHESLVKDLQDENEKLRIRLHEEQMTIHSVPESDEARHERERREDRAYNDF